MSILLFVGTGILLTLATIALSLSFAFGLRESWLLWALAVSGLGAVLFWARLLVIFKHLASM